MPPTHEAIEAPLRKYELTESTAHYPQPSHSHPIDVRPENWQEVRLFHATQPMVSLDLISYITKHPEDCIMQGGAQESRRPGKRTIAYPLPCLSGHRYLIVEILAPLMCMQIVLVFVLA
jgi:hypothetical protein